MLHTTALRTPYGPLWVQATAEGVRFVHFTAPDQQGTPNAYSEAAAAQLAEYFQGQRRIFEVPLDRPSAAAFRRHVQDHLNDIAFGQRATYGQLAATLGRSGAARAVGTACALNPVPILVACHRVVPAHGGIGNYAGGRPWKQALLDHEQAVLGR